MDEPSMDEAGLPAHAAASPTSIDVILRDLLRLRLGPGLGDLSRLRGAENLAALPVFEGTFEQQGIVFWQIVDTMRDVGEFAPSTHRPGRLPPSGREWHRLLEVIFNRAGTSEGYVKRLRNISSNLPQDFPVLSSYYGVTTSTSSRMTEAATDAVQILARWIVSKISSSMPREQISAQSSVSQNPTLSATGASVVVSTSAIQYSYLIVAHEHGASRIDRIPKRLSVLFKSEDAVVDIAEQRFGPGSSQVDAYVREHRERKDQFYAQLSSGLVCREIYTKDELKSYFSTGLHGRLVHLAKEHIEANLTNWLNCLERYSGYMVALTDEAVPLKYEVINRQTVVIHEAIGGNDRDRLNAIFITSVGAGQYFQNDFDLIWDRTPIAFRKTENIVNWTRDLIMEKL